MPTTAAFERVADDTLRALERALADVDSLEVDLQMGVMTLEFADGAKYIINSHRAAKQIWMAAERTAWHFDPVAQGREWKAPKENRALHARRRVLRARRGSCCTPTNGAR
ncbi:MAG TPA: iron donor protein CyaY [Polyangium sp.]|nr:iron donor protein CyaY [Polyangium sp.]